MKKNIVFFLLDEQAARMGSPGVCIPETTHPGVVPHEWENGRDCFFYNVAYSRCDLRAVKNQGGRGNV